VSSTCPIITGDNIDLNGGNMQGSCTSSDPNAVYSTFGYSDSFPRCVDGMWEADEPAIPQICPLTVFVFSMLELEVYAHRVSEWCRTSPVHLPDGKDQLFLRNPRGPGRLFSLRRSTGWRLALL
jgi:hypothetical protein